MTLVLSLLAALTSQAPDNTLWVQLGPRNSEHGLSVPSAGDGENVATTLGGEQCRRVAGGRSPYLYIKADDALAPPGDRDVYLTVEFYDEHMGYVPVQYDRAGGGAYEGADEGILMLGSSEWRRQTVRLAHAALSNRQNWQADLRLCSADIAVRRIELSLTAPEGYRPGGADPALLERLSTRIGAGMELTLGNDVGAGMAELYKALGVTSVESYVTWQTVEDRGDGGWDWSRWDRQVEVLKNAGLKWVPFLIAGPAYANPAWFRNSEESFACVCLEHGLPSKVESIWNPRLPARVDRFLAAFADRYRDSGVIESLLLGISGIYGESIYPAGPEGGWTADIPGQYHNHVGWWAGDARAAESFRAAMEKRYGTVAALNAAWGTAYGTFADVAPFLPEKAPSLRAKVDFTNWYVDEMTHWATLWVGLTRKHFPSTEIYLCTGGDGNPVLGADFTAQARAIAPSGAGIRITNEGSDYLGNFAITREVATACRAYGTFFGYEPASGVDANGVVVRIYNATASGARQLHYYSDNVLSSGDAIANFRQYAADLQRREPRIHAAVYLPKTSWAADPATIGPTYDAARRVRARVDVEFLDRLTIASTSAMDLAVVTLAGCPYIEPDEAAGLRDWVAQGHVLVALAPREGLFFITPEGDTAARDELFATPSARHDPIRVSLAGPPPRRFRLLVGSAGDDAWLLGDWHGRETGPEWPDIPGATKRWSQARAGAWMPIDPSQDAVLTIDACLGEHSLTGPNRVLVNGTEVGRLDKAGIATYRLAVPRAVLGGANVAEVSFEMTTWRPLDYGMGDARDLGVALRMLDLCTAGAENEEPGTATIRLDVDAERVRAECVRRVGSGATVLVPYGSKGPDGLAAVVELALRDPASLGLPGGPVSLPTTDATGVFATELPDGWLYLNTGDQAVTVEGVSVPAHGIAEEPAGG